MFNIAHIGTTQFVYTESATDPVCCGTLRGGRDGPAMVVILAAAGGLLLFVGACVYGAIVVGKKADQMGLGTGSEEETAPTMSVRFPDEVFQPKDAAFDKR